MQSRYVAALAPLLLVAGCAEFMTKSSSPVDFGEMKLELATRDTHPRVKETGYDVRIKLDVEGFQGRRIPIQLFDSANHFLGESIAVPSYASTTWSGFSVFVPASRLANVASNPELVAYALSPERENTYLEKNTYRWNDDPGLKPESIWEFRGLREAVPASSEDKSHEIKVKLYIRGQRNRKFQVVLMARDMNLKEFEGALGGPIHAEQFPVEQTYDETEWRELTLRLPYSAVAKLPLGKQFLVTPALRHPDGSLVWGNLHVRLYAGGSLEEIAAQFRSATSELDEDIARMERQIQVLQGGAARK